MTSWFLLIKLPVKLKYWLEVGTFLLVTAFLGHNNPILFIFIALCFSFSTALPIVL